MRARASKGGPPVYAITGARKSLRDDIRDRQRRYAISMSIRTICFGLAIVTHGPLRWLFFLGALVLPYFAVVMANSGREPPPAQAEPYVPPPPNFDAPPPQLDPPPPTDRAGEP
jgi:hypothetical protein